MLETIAAHLDAVAALAPTWGYVFIFVFMAIESSVIPFPSEVVMIPAGFLAARGELGGGGPAVCMALAVLVGVLGSLAGAYANYFFALLVGKPFLEKYGKWFFVKPGPLARACEVFNRYGAVTTFVCRLVPVIRQLISIPAGIAKMPLGEFTLFTGLGAGIWAAVLAVVGFALGRTAGDMTYLELVTRGRDMAMRHLPLVIGGAVVLGAAYMAFSKWVKPRLSSVSSAACLALCAALPLAGLAGPSAAGEWPFVVIRHTETLNGKPEVFARLMESHRRHRGACDEFWFATGGRRTPEALAVACADFARFRPLCDEAGIALSCQQGLTLGHGEAHDGAPKPGEQQFPDDAWQRDRNGNKINFLCPRSPDVLAYERACAKAVISVAAPASYWLDDDLRLGVCKPQGCFCDRCIAAFNAKTGGGWTRETLAARLFSDAVREPVRAAWVDFNAESLAVYAAEVRAAADELKSPCRLAYQSVWADTVYTASSYRPLLKALSGEGRNTVGIRPGAGYYTEAEPRGMVAKCLSVAREAERCRSYGGLVGSVCYEQETYPRHVLHKSPGAIMTECALALASGCDALSLYWYSASAPEPIEEYDRFIRTLAAARPYFERLAASTRRTRLGGVARYLGLAALESAAFDLRDSKDFELACAGVPVTVAEARPVAWYLTGKSREVLTDADKALLQGAPAVEVDDVEKYPLASRRARLLDDLDRATGGTFPVRVDECRALRILPRVREDGSLDSVTLVNLSIGDTDALKVRVRRPVSQRASWQGVKTASAPLAMERGAAADEFVVTLPNLSGWQAVTVFFD